MRQACSVQASQIYPISSRFNVQAHQLWAACTLFQATGEAQFSTLMIALYRNMDREAGGKRIYWPIPNYDNPVQTSRVLCFPPR